MAGGDRRKLKFFILCIRLSKFTEAVMVPVFQRCLVQASAGICTVLIMNINVSLQSFKTIVETVS